MTFGSIESSRSLGEPDTLYRFTVGSIVYGYTDSEEAILFAGTAYLPIPIDRDGVSTSGSLDNTVLKIRMPHTAEIAEEFRVYQPSEVIGVAIFQGHADDPDTEFLSIYAGRVMSCSREGSMAILSCEPVSTSMKRPGLRRNFMYSCPHALYSPPCGVSREAFTFTLAVAALANNQIVLAPGWNGPYGATKFIGGLVEWTIGGRTELRTILRASSADNVLTLSGNVVALQPGSTVRVSLGCNHMLLDGGDCSAVFNNAPNFGGQPWIPTDNPVSSVNRFY